MDDKSALELVKKGYDSIYEGYNKQRKGDRREVRDLAALLPEKSLVLDVGCGSGHITKFLVEEGFRAIGTDISKNMLKLAKKKVPKAKFYLRDMRKLKFRKNAFDAITSFYAIIHLPRKYHLAVLKGFNRILKPNGFLMISVGGGPLKGDTDENWMGLGSKMYWSHFGIKKNLQLIRKAGFRVLWCRFIGPKNDRHPLILAQKIK